MLPDALLPGSINLVEHAVAVHLTGLPLTLVIVAVGEQELAFALLFALDPVAHIG